MTRRLRHIVVGLLLVAWLGAAADGTGRLKNYDIWKDMPSERLMEMGKRFYLGDKPDSALMCFNIIANRYYTTPKGDKDAQRLVGSAMNQLGILYTYVFIDYSKAHQHLLQAQKIAKDLNDNRLLAATYTNLGNIHWIDSFYSNDGQLDSRTIELHQKAFETALAANAPKSVILTASNLIKIAEDTANTDAVRNDINQFLSYQIPDSMRQYEYVKTCCRAFIEQDRGNLEEASVLYNKALDEIYGENDKDREIERTNIMVSKFHLLIKMGKDQQALSIINDLIDQGKAADDHHLLFFYYKNLSEYYYQKKDSVNGVRYEFQALREKDIVLNKNKLLDAEKADFLFQIDEINAEVQELAYRHKLTKYIAWGIAAITLIILGFLYLLWRRYRQEQEKNRKLYENNLMLLAAEEERRQQIIEEQQTPKYQSHQVEEGELSDLLHRILYVMETSEEIYDNNFSLDRLAELIDANSRYYVSQVLNEHYHQSFPEMVNDYRIREACRRINDHEHYSQFTVQAIAESVGFGSYPNFVTNFKKFTGLTPSAYRKQGKDKSGSPAE